MASTSASLRAYWLDSAAAQRWIRTVMSKRQRIPLAAKTIAASAMRLPMFKPERTTRISRCMEKQKRGTPRYGGLRSAQTLKPRRRLENMAQLRSARMPRQEKKDIQARLQLVRIALRNRIRLRRPKYQCKRFIGCGRYVCKRSE